MVPLGLSVPASLALVGGWGWLAVQLFDEGLVVPMLAPMVAGALVFGALSVLLATLAVRERVRVKGLFARYVHADVVRELIDGDDARKPRTLAKEFGDANVIQNRGSVMRRGPRQGDAESRVVELPVPIEGAAV